jgi:hypothetical protein
MMKLKNFASATLAVVLALGMAQPSFAEEYVPPPEAFQGVGGWAVVDGNGNVYGVIVGDFNEQVWEEVKDTRTVDGYMGCPAPCGLRFQTRATADGNVAGWHGTQTNVDSDGNASQTNDGSVRYDAPSGNFEITNDDGNGATTVQTLIPEKTSRNADGTGTSMNLSTGIVDIRTSKRITSGSESADVTIYRENLADSTADVEASLPSVSNTTLRYVFGGETGASTDEVESDLVSILIGMGLTTTVTSVDEETGEETSTEVLDESNPFVSAVLNVGRGIVEFLTSLFGIE